MMPDVSFSRGKVSVLGWIVLLQPVVWWAVLSILPTFDDWTYLTRPQLGSFDVGLLLPWSTYWRPFDGLMGYVVGRNLALFPVLNHVLILTAHLLSTFLLDRIARKVGLGRFATNLACVFFYVSPAMLGTVLDIDSMNQAFSLMWGLVAVCAALSSGRFRRVWMGGALLLAALCKENGLCFVAVVPMLLYVLQRKTLREVVHEGLFLAAVAGGYLAVRFCLPQQNVELGGVYVDGGWMQRLRNVGMYVAFTWVPVDFVSLLHAPSRNMWFVVLTLALGLPLFGMLFWSQRRQLLSRRFVGLQLCALLAAAMHLLTLFTVMHAYAGLAFTALSLGYLADHVRRRRCLMVACGLWLVSALITDIHHVVKARESGIMGREMARQAIERTGNPVKRVKLVMVDDGYPRYSMFCVIPHEAFGWGIAAQFETGYQWPERIDRAYVAETEMASIPSMADEACREGYDCVWVAYKDHVEIVRKR